MFSQLKYIIDWFGKALFVTGQNTPKQQTMEESIYTFSPFQLKKIHYKRDPDQEIPRPRSGHRIVADEYNLYSFGGYSPVETDVSENLLLPGILFSELWKFNLSTKSWSLQDTTGEMPQHSASHAANMFSNNMLVFGGTGVPFGMNSSNSVHLCDLETSQWSTLETTGSEPEKRYGQAIALDGDKLYVVGGTDGYNYSSAVHCLDLNTKEWSNLQTITAPDPRYRHEIAIKGNDIFVFGGGTSEDSYDLKNIPVFNIIERTWRYVYTSAEHPANRLCHGCVQVGDNVYITGGHNNNESFSDIWKINLIDLQWVKLAASLPTTLHFHATTVSPLGEMLIFGGTPRLRENERSNELLSMWLKIPPLSEICWQAVLHYIPKIVRIEKRKLIETGVPSRLVERLDDILFSDDDDDL